MEKNIISKFHYSFCASHTNASLRFHWLFLGGYHMQCNQKLCSSTAVTLSNWRRSCFTNSNLVSFLYKRTQKYHHISCSMIDGLCRITITKCYKIGRNSCPSESITERVAFKLVFLSNADNKFHLQPWKITAH